MNTYFINELNDIINLYERNTMKRDRRSKAAKHKEMIIKSFEDEITRREKDCKDYLHQYQLNMEIINVLKNKIKSIEALNTKASNEEVSFTTN